MVAALLAAALLQASHGPTFSEGQETPVTPSSTTAAPVIAPGVPTPPAEVAAAQATPVVKVTAAASAGDDVRVCQSTQTTGSLFSQRVCHTRGEWREMGSDARNLLDETEKRGLTAAFVGGH